MPPLQYALVHLRDIQHVVAHAVVYGGYVVLCWTDGVTELHRADAVADVLVAQYGGQYEAQLSRESSPERYQLTETSSAKPKAFAFVWLNGSATIVWDDGVVESWASFDSVVVQYAFAYTFASLDR